MKTFLSNSQTRAMMKGRQKVDGVCVVRFSTPSVSPPILGEKKFVYTLVFAFIFGFIFDLILAFTLGLIFGFIRERA